MPLTIEGPVPAAWAERGKASAGTKLATPPQRAECITIAFINNMPDAALEDTELQFFELLDIASGDVPVTLKLFSLTGVPRTERGQRHLNDFYASIEELWDNRFDGMIMTGTEPRCADLRQEPYWPVLAETFDWAERSTTSTVLSCLAAHAGVLHADNILRHRLPDKQFGVFAFAKTASHPLTGATGDFIRFPHSRWNELRAAELVAGGYTVLTQSPEGGVDSFLKKRKRSLFLHLQGHPEYGAQTLLKEYRRDIRRFLKKERDTYPTMPQGYFDPAATAVLSDFRQIAEPDRREEHMEACPEAAVIGTLQKNWHSSAVGIYRNWLTHVLATKPEAQTFPALAATYPHSRKRSALR
jgi:homoserine O-succinyltransferase